MAMGDSVSIYLFSRKTFRLLYSVRGSTQRLLLEEEVEEGEEEEEEWISKQTL